MTNAPDLQISLAAWSMHRLFADGEIDQMGMLRLCHELGIEGFEFVNRFFPSPQYQYLVRLRETAEELDIRLLLIMCDGEGDMAATDRAERLQAASNHHKWIDIARVLGCRSIRCNVRGDESDMDAMLERAMESFRGLLTYADAAGVDVVVENHGGPSSDPGWLVALVQAVDHPRFGTLPDFGNFPPDVDRYEAVAKLMPHAKGVSAKCYDFDADGNESTIDFARMLGIVRDAGYRGFVGIEYEGRNLPEREGIASALQLLRRTI